jgi:Tfp pilus assembly protein PilV
MSHIAQTAKFQSRSGSVLLEVILALVLFVAAATIITAGMNASVAAVERLRRDSHTLDLALSVMAELQMNARPLESAGPEPFEAPFDDWMWRVDVSALESASVEADALKKVEVTVWHTTENSNQRIAELFRSDDVAPAPESSGTSTNYFSPFR